MSKETVIAAFIDEVKAILAAQGPSAHGLELIAERMRDLVNNHEVTQEADDPVGNIHGGGQSAPLYVDDSGITLVRGRFGPEAMTPVHNHGSWGIVGVYRGRDRYQIWRRLDDGADSTQARVELEDELILDPGDVVIMPPPPQDVHAQQGADGQPVFEFVLFGKNTMHLPRLYFDPEQGTAREVLPGQRT